VFATRHAEQNLKDGTLTLPSFLTTIVPSTVT
jgi:hypothetical protein